MNFNESHVEDAALEWFGELGYASGHGPEMAPGELSSDWNRDALRRMNSTLIAELT